jgi:hypothetical protein
MTRRDFLQGLAAAPALAVARSLAGGDRYSASQFTASPFQQLNVIFHGLSVINFSSDAVHVYLPIVATDYAHLAGSWMQEVPLARGARYRLSGMMTGPRPELRVIDPNQNAVFAAQVADRALSFCELVLPFPDFLIPLRMVRKERRRNFFMGSPQPIVQPSAVPEILVFSYVHPDPTSSLQFRPLDWTPVIMGGVIDLHIWDAPAKAPSVQEAKHAFEQMAKMIGSSTLQLDPFYAEIKPPEPDEDPSVAGLSCQQEWTLVERLGHPDGCGNRRRRDAPKAPWDSLSLILY